MLSSNIKDPTGLIEITKKRAALASKSMGTRIAQKQALSKEISAIVDKMMQLEPFFLLSNQNDEQFLTFLKEDEVVQDIVKAFSSGLVTILSRNLGVMEGGSNQKYSDMEIFKIALNDMLKTNGASMQNYLSVNAKLAQFLKENVDNLIAVYDKFKAYQQKRKKLAANFSNYTIIDDYNPNALKEKQAEKIATVKPSIEDDAKLLDEEVYEKLSAKTFYPDAKVYSKRGELLDEFSLDQSILVIPNEKQAAFLPSEPLKKKPSTSGWNVGSLLGKGASYAFDTLSSYVSTPYNYK